MSFYPAIVIRPSGVWNSRAPFHDFLYHHRLNARLYYATVLALSKIRLEAHETDPQFPAKQFFRSKHAGRIAGRAWIRYRKSVPPAAKGERGEPTVADAEKDVTDAFYPTLENALISYTGMFETYVQCWALNYLLASLESGRQWTADEKKLARALSPLRERGNLPGVPQIIRDLPVLEGLSLLPHVHIDAATDKELTEPVSSELNALETIRFWRAYRNLVVHNSGMVNIEFYERHGNFHDALRSSLPAIRPLQVGRPVVHNDVTMMTVASTHLKVAQWMNQHLETASAERRGHPHAPEPKQADVWFSWPPPRAPRLLMDGDHAESLKWETDADFRATLLAQFGRKPAVRSAVIARPSHAATEPIAPQDA